MGRLKKRPGKDPGPRTDGVIAHVRGSADYRAWFDGLQHHSRYPKATLVRMGLELVAEKLGFKPPPEI